MYQLYVKRLDGEDSKAVGEPGANRRQLERVEIGMSINLDHENWYTEIVEVEDES